MTLHRCLSRGLQSTFMNAYQAGDHIAIRNNHDNTTRTVTQVEGDEIHYQCLWHDGSVHPGRAAAIDVTRLAHADNVTRLTR